MGEAARPKAWPGRPAQPSGMLFPLPWRQKREREKEKWKGGEEPKADADEAPPYRL